MADVASYVRNSFGNAASFVPPEDVLRIRAATADRRGQWTVPELEASLPVALAPDERWRVSASHASTSAANAFNLSGWSTGSAQQAGMWFQVELPAVTTLDGDAVHVAVSGRRAWRSAARATFPRGYRADVSMDGTSWTTVDEKSRYRCGDTMGVLAPVPARFVRISLTTTDDRVPAWAMQRLRLYAVPAPE